MYPQEVEDMFNLIEEFDHNNEISETEFLSACTRNKKLENFLRITVLEESRCLIAQKINQNNHNLKKLQNNEADFTNAYISLTDEKSSNSSEQLNMFSTCSRISYFDWICRKSKHDEESKYVEKCDKSNYGTTQNNDDWKSVLEKGCESKIRMQDKELTEDRDGVDQVFGTCNSSFQ